ncbi:MAG: membrane protein insertion efficiency factor YidD [Acidobacteriota bacterium]|nr:membrane protein insertion efficiency factor YidD [Acidobacteriota bacterium]
MRRAASVCLLALIRGYQLLLSPFYTGACRYVPSCSEYAAGAIHDHGALKGAYLAARRLSRCHPLGGSGLDPVPRPAPGTRTGTGIHGT